MLEDRAVFVPTEHPFAYVGGGDGTMVLDHEFVIVRCLCAHLILISFANGPRYSLMVI